MGWSHQIHKWAHFLINILIEIVYASIIIGFVEIPIDIPACIDLFVLIQPLIFLTVKVVY